LLARPSAAETAAVGAVLLVAACGGGPLDGRTGPEVAEAAADVLAEAGAFHLVGTVSRGGVAGDVDPHLSEDAVGTLTLGGSEGRLETVVGVVHVQAPLSFWNDLETSAGFSAADVANRWVM
jgi:hypothetical protein